MPCSIKKNFSERSDRYPALIERQGICNKKMENRVNNICAALSVQLTQENIDDIMVSALEGGICYWCNYAEVIEDKRVAEWGHEQIARGGVLMLHDAEEDDVYELTKEKFINGFRLWLENGDDLYGAVTKDGVDCGQIDGAMADMIIQYALFGEVLYS